MLTPPKLAAAVIRRLKPRFSCYREAARLVAGRSGLEIGGPSSLFAGGGPFPVYGVVGKLDNCNFSRTTVWEGAIADGDTFVFDARRPAGHQYIHESTDLASVPAGHYEFVLSSHTLEHSANPLKALREWMRVLADGGALVLVVPHYEGTFDHRRSVTQLEHVIADEAAGVGEDDLTHLEEILDRHDLSLDPPAGDLEAFTSRSRRNLENRCLHHHVFDTNLVAQTLDHAGFEILALDPNRPYHIVALARKAQAGPRPDNRAFLGPAAAYRRTSPFAADRRTNV